MSTPLDSARVGPAPLSRRAVLGGLALAVAGGAPSAGGADRRELAAAPPRLEADSFTSFDGARLPLRVWPSAPGDPDVVVLALHGFDDYAAAFDEAGRYWAARGATTYAFDQRGFGRAPGRGRWAGDEPMAEDVRVLAALLRARHPRALLAVVGESMGGAVAIEAFAGRRPPDADRLVLLSPAVWGWSGQPLLNAVGLRVLQALVPDLELRPTADMAEAYRCSDNLAALRRMDADPNVINATRVEATYGLVGLMERASRDIARLRVPTLYAYGGNDRMIPRPAAVRAAARLGPRGRTAFYPDGWHLLDRDLEAERVLGDALAFIRSPAGVLPSGAGPIPAPDARTA